MAHLFRPGISTISQKNNLQERWWMSYVKSQKFQNNQLIPELKNVIIRFIK